MEDLIDKLLGLKAAFKLSMLFASGLFISIYTRKIWSSYKYFKLRKLPTPKINFLYGNIFELHENQNESQTIFEWTKKLGKTYGYFEGHTPILVTSDLEIINEVFIKQFSNFSARKKNPMEGAENRAVNHLMRSSKSRWKRMRLIMNPIFTNAKLNKMNSNLIECTNKLISQIANKANNRLIFINYLKRFTMDTLWSCSYGLDIDVQNDLHNEYFHAAEKVFSEAHRFKFLNFLSILFPELNFLWNSIFHLVEKFKTVLFKKEPNPKLWIMNEFDKTLKQRLSQRICKDDYMQLLLNALSIDDKETTKHDHLHLVDSHSLNLEKRLTYAEIKANLKMFMLAGYESTSYALNYCFYVLAINQNEQQTLLNEIDSFYSKEVEPTTENVKDLSYLDLFCKEILRFFPISRVVRRCVKDTEIKGIKMTRDLIVRIDHMAIHFDPDLWGPTDPYVFDPLRHDQKRDALSFLAFGVGPRICLGMKFALIQMKLALVKVLLEYEVCATEDTPKSLEYIEGILRSAKSIIPIVFKKRQVNQA